MASNATSHGWNSFLQLVADVQSHAELDELMQALLTHEERNQLALRVELIRELLQKQKPQRQIASELGVSVATITRGSNMLKSIRTNLLSFLEKHLVRER